MNTLAYDLKGKRVWVAGHRGMAGSAILRRLASEDCECLTAPSSELDLRRQADVEAWVELCAGRVPNFFRPRCARGQGRRRLARGDSKSEPRALQTTNVTGR